MFFQGMFIHFNLYKFPSLRFSTSSSSDCARSCLSSIDPSSSCLASHRGHPLSIEFALWIDWVACPYPCPRKCRGTRERQEMGRKFDTKTNAGATNWLAQARVLTRTRSSSEDCLALSIQTKCPEEKNKDGEVKAVGDMARKGLEEGAPRARNKHWPPN